MFPPRNSAWFIFVILLWFYMFSFRVIVAAPSVHIRIGASCSDIICVFHACIIEPTASHNEVVLNSSRLLLFLCTSVLVVVLRPSDLSLTNKQTQATRIDG